MFSKISRLITEVVSGSEMVLFKKITSSGCDSVYLYGAGAFGQEVFDLLQGESTINVTGFFDKKAEKFSFQLAGIPVLSPAEVANLPQNATLAIASKAFVNEIISALTPLLADKQVTLIHL